MSKEKTPFNVRRVILYTAGFASTFLPTLYGINKYQDWLANKELIAEGDAIASTSEYREVVDSFDESKAIREVPSRFYNAFLSVSNDPVDDVHDCDDMEQELRDKLVTGGVPIERIRHVRAIWRRNFRIGHRFLEVLVDKDDHSEWRVFDPGMKKFNCPPIILERDFKIIEYFPGDDVYNEDGGYQKFGDQWNSSGKCWVNSDEDFKKLSITNN